MTSTGVACRRERKDMMLLQVAGVQYVLDTVIYALLADPNRKFAYAEMVRVSTETDLSERFQSHKSEESLLAQAYLQKPQC